MGQLIRVNSCKVTLYLWLSWMVAIFFSKNTWAKNTSLQWILFSWWCCTEKKTCPSPETANPNFITWWKLKIKTKNTHKSLMESWNRPFKGFSSLHDLVKLLGVPCPFFIFFLGGGVVIKPWRTNISPKIWWVGRCDVLKENGPGF